MKMDRWSSWLQILANLGLMVGLLLVVIEIQQTRDLTRLELQLEGLGSFQEVGLAMMGEDPAEVWAKSILAPASLSPDEVIVVDGYLIHVVNVWRRTLLLEEEGLVEPGTTESIVRGNAWFYFGNAFAKEWWRTMARDGLWDPEFLRIVNAEVDAQDERYNARWIEELTTEATSLGR